MKPHEQVWRQNELEARTVETSDGLRVAEAYPASDDGGYAEQVDVARLISAAPDMARVLLDLLEFEVGSDLRYMLGSARINSMRSALHKAGVLL